MAEGPCRAGGPDWLELLALVLRGSRDESCQKRGRESPKVSTILRILLVLFSVLSLVDSYLPSPSPLVHFLSPAPPAPPSPATRVTSCRSSFCSYSFLLQEAQMFIPRLESHTRSRLWDSSFNLRLHHGMSKVTRSVFPRTQCFRTLSSQLSF